MSPPSSNDLNSRFAKACELHTRSKYAAAENIYHTLLEQLPDSSLLHYNIGLLYYETGEFKKALSHYSTARNVAPDDPDILFNYALCQKKLGLFHDAILSFELFTGNYPDDPDGFYNLGNCYREIDVFDKAGRAYSRVLEIAPNHLSANKNLAYICHLLGDNNKATLLYEHILSLDPDNAQIKHMIAAIKGEDAVQAPPEYVREIFNNYSETFEKNLLDDLHYTVPEQLKSGVDRLNRTCRKFGKGIDLGCGSGLAGVEFNQQCRHLTGVDLSEKMIEKARSKNIYKVLEIAEVLSFLQTRRNEFDLVIAADFITYIGDLDPVFKAVTSAVTEQALFCFSTEKNDQSGFKLRLTGRFAHAREYVHETAVKHGWQCLDTIETGLRKEKGEWVEGILYFMVKSG